MQIEGELKIAPLFDKRAHKRWSVSLAEIDSYRRIHPNIAPEKKAILNAQYQARLAEPLTCLVVVLIAIPFAAPAGRRNAAVGVAAGIIACLASACRKEYRDKATHRATTRWNEFQRKHRLIALRRGASTREELRG